MLLKHRSSWLLVLFISGLLLCFPPVLSAESPEAAMSERLVDLGLRIERQIELAQFNLERGTLDPTILKRQAEEAATALEGLEGQIHTLPEETRDPLLLKLVSVKGQADNLALAAKLNSAPPRRTPADTWVGHLDRRGQTRSTPANDDCDAAFVVDFGTFAGDTTDATNDGQAVCGASLYSPDVWYRYIAPAHGTVVVDTVGSAYDTVLSVHSGCPGTMNNQIVCNDDAAGLQAAVSFTAYAGNEYLIRVSGANGATGSYLVTVSQGGSIEGTVTQTGTGLPVSTRVQIFDDSGYQVASNDTDTSGIYRVDSLISGQYFVATDTFTSQGAYDELYDNQPCPWGEPNGCDVTTGDPVSITVGTTTGGIDFILDRGGLITGIVQDEQTGAPIEGLLVALYNENGSSLSADYTDSSGVYSFHGWPEDTYFVAATSSDYVDELYDDIPCPGGPGTGCNLEDGLAVQVTLNTTTSGIDFALEKLGAIGGTTTDRSTGLPISSAIVRVYDGQGTYLTYDYTDSDGAYEFGSLEDGTYYLSAYRHSDYAEQLFDGIDCPVDGCQVLTGTPVVISNQVPVADIDFDLIKKGIITGNVIDSTTSTPRQGVLVRAYNLSGSAVDYGYTDSIGNFEIDSLDAGTYFVATATFGFLNELFDSIPCPSGCDPTTGTPVVVLTGQTITSIDFSIIPMGSLTGSVVAEDGSGNAIMNMLLYDSSGTYLKSRVSYGGVYQFGGLDDGQYFLVAERYTSALPFLGELYNDIPCWGGPPNGCVITEGTPITITAATVTSGIDFSLRRGGTVYGGVADAVNGTPVSGRVYVREAGGSRVWYDYLYGGAYSLEGLYPGDYLIIADAYTHVDEVWQGIPCAGEYPESCDLSDATPVTVTADSQIGLYFHLQPLGKVSGTVRSTPTGAPLGGYSVVAFDTEGDPIGTVSTNSSGEYEISGLWPATLFVATDEHNLNFVDQLYSGIDCPQGPPDGCDPTTGTPLIVDINTSLQNIDFNLERTGSISGRVTDGSTGLPLSWVNVELWNVDGEYLRYDSTDSQGYFEFGGLEARSFFVATGEFYTSSTYLDMLYDGIPCPTGPPAGCDPTKGTPIPVVQGTATRFIDLALPRWESGISGMVSDLSTGEPITGVFIDLWDADTGAYEVGLLTSPAGTYIADVDPGTYIASTDNSGDWINQIFEGIECHAGSPYNGDCDPMTGTVITVEDGELTPDINFLLRPSGSSVFANGFETGDTTGWDFTMP